MRRGLFVAFLIRWGTSRSPQKIDAIRPTAGRFREILTRLSLPGDSTIHYEKGDPADSILRALAANPIDLIVAGALDGSSGFILAIIMCRAMNRSFSNVLCGALSAIG